MSQETVTFRLDQEKKAALDIIAAELGRDRDDVLNEAVAAYLDIHQWQIEHIREGVRQADAGAFATDEEVAAAFARWRR